ncbi:MAG: hypothetical protein MPJ06_03565 [Nitrosopumilus sp.]|nr:hypothetical protein [Nitrosopumilus sp.]MDA7942059.1 hypothetical protein [Nitrosopumilus sp.]MDA7943069.1 hypothetical protein [Nitrosopumilus sp.]MDA7955419.1 hypothetical protein [Nitrosopumilus sp.]MDA7997656.1 hypothetical protein [Nitrosopumilus sp.]
MGTKDGYDRTWRIRNTFAPDCDNEYFTPVTIFSLWKHGFPLRDMPEEAQKMALEYKKIYLARCTGPDEKIVIPRLKVDPDGMVVGVEDEPAAKSN